MKKLSTTKGMASEEPEVDDYPVADPGDLPMLIKEAEEEVCRTARRVFSTTKTTKNLLRITK